MAFFHKEVSPLPMEPEPVVQVNHEDDLGSFIKDASVCTVLVPGTLDRWMSCQSYARRQVVLATGPQRRYCHTDRALPGNCRSSFVLARMRQRCEDIQQ